METNNELRSIQIACFDVLKKYREVCEKYGLRYYLAFGTLLGAIRHKGYIPWDDDIDVWMPRPDLERFLVIAQEEMKPYVINYYTISNQASMKYRSQPCIENQEFRRVGFKLGKSIVPGYVWIDIMPLDGMPEESGRIKVQNGLFRFWYMILGFARSSKVGAFNPDSKTGLKRLGMKINEAINIGKLFDIEKCLMLFDHCRKRYKYEDCKNCTGTTSSYTDKVVFPKSWIEGEREELFEGELFSVPIMSELILSQLYGNYLNLPPEEKRTGSHFHILNYEEFIHEEG